MSSAFAFGLGQITSAYADLSLPRRLSRSERTTRLLATKPWSPRKETRFSGRVWQVAGGGLLPWLGLSDLMFRTESTPVVLKGGLRGLEDPRPGEDAACPAKRPPDGGYHLRVGNIVRGLL